MVRTSQVTSANPMVSMLWTCPFKETPHPCPKFVCEDNCGIFSQKPDPANEKKCKPCSISPALSVLKQPL